MDKEMTLGPMRRTLLLLLLLVLAWARPAAGYSLLTHEQLIDLAWRDSIVPLLLSHYPGLTPAQLDEARAYAYGGCVIQDLGYYPFGDGSFSDLTHYVRSGDFVVSLFRNAKSADELAFAVGALSHYIGDSVEFPKLQAKYGPVINYAEGEHQHVQTEFAFDIDEIAHHRLAPMRFLRHIGLQVPTKQLALAYYQTYGLQEDFTSRRGRRFNVRNYRFAVRTFIPQVADAIALLHRRHEPPEPDTAEYKEIVAEAAAVDQENNWDSYRGNAGVESHLLAALLFVLPKIGPLKLVAVKGPTTATEADYMHSLVLSITIFRHMLERFTPPAPNSGNRDGHAPPPPAALMAILAATSPDILLRSHDPQHPLPNRDLDTGYVVRPGGYRLTDSTYAALLHRITQQPTQSIPPGIKKDVQNYYADPNSPISTTKDAQQWAQVQADLTTLASMPTSNAPEPYTTYGDEAANTQ
jgi:hypothetical protein